MATKDAVLQDIHLDTGSPDLLHKQFRGEIERLIRSGRLSPGDRLPTAQAFSQGCGISLTTVSRALTDMGKDGLLTAKPGDGTYVAVARVPTTEVLIIRKEQSPDPEQRAFHAQVVEGLQAGYGDEPRRFLSSYVTPDSFIAGEVLQAARARCVDGLVLVGDVEDNAWEAGRLARDIPCVCVATWPPSTEAGSVIVDPCDALTRLVRSRFQAGQRRFAYAGIGQMHRAAQQMFDAFHRCMREFGIAAPTWMVSFEQPKDESYQTSRREFVKNLPTLEPGTTALLYHPQLAGDIANASLDLISYTESRHTLETFRDRVTILYGGLERQARAAVPLLKAIRNGEAAGQRCVRIEPELFGPGGLS